MRRAESEAEVLRGFAETRYAAEVVEQGAAGRSPDEASASDADDMLRRGIQIPLRRHPRCRAVMPSIFMKRSTAPVGRPRTSSSTARHNWRLIALMPIAAGRPTATDPAPGAYWLLLDLRARDPELESAAEHRVRYESVSCSWKSPDVSSSEPHSYRARLAMLPGGRDVQSCRAQAATVRTISSRGDDAPPSPDPLTPNASTAFSTQSICRRYARRNG